MPIAESNSYIVLRTGLIMTAEGLTFKDYSLVVIERGRHIFGVRWLKIYIR